MPAVTRFCKQSRLLLLTIGLALPYTAHADFAECVAGLQEKAKQEGISEKIVDEALGQVKLSERVIELDGKQPEFIDTFTNYLNRRVTDERVNKGREMLAKHAPLLDQIAKESGVPAQYLVAFWGLETNYGGYTGKMPILDSLATLACDPRRSGYFTGELMAALKIIEKGDVTVDKMLGSWAGAMGNFQFMPSVYLQYATDRDGDGKRDLWGSLPDAAASAGLFLNGLGWQNGFRWGREVKLPENFAYGEAGLKRSKTLSEWRELGVLDADGREMPNLDLQAALIIPSGHLGPKFLVYDNFKVIMRWNRSESYAIAVGHLADRIAGAGRLRQTPPELPRLPLTAVADLQQKLTDKGFDAGKSDGIMGPATRDAIRAFQEKQGMIADGYPNPEVLQALDIKIQSES
ncbi:Membrane-bound lytic murein transglycosylase B [Hahella chejuensis KCTC 2396]|uniref:Membrane-bound lytic murein transglycosylase B n=1 Tax=Hahella chejuensis (strain KCTC 2396) TaxID=349521 RepID=Q2SIX7_HAHCH|nr:lytic murein transglycosylase [Hahella chejuensis]ABC29397.1 Membrane-bound lytic murein transglycosylase B [Hahella chejuensis KCTC 2396]